MSEIVSTAGESTRSLAIVFGLTAAYMIAEVVGGLLTNSLALLADAGHMLTDAGALGLALLAIWFAKRPATPEKSYGYYRAEILAALGNGVVLVLVSIYIIYEAWRRLQNPPHVLSGPMLAIAVLGLGVNLAGIKLLHTSADQSLNVHGAYLEVLSDLLGSVGVIVASLIMLTTGWLLADPIISMGIGLFIIPRTWKLLKEASHILMEGTPAGFDVQALDKAVRSIPGVIALHDLHVWTITSGWNALSGHFVVQQNADNDFVLSELRRIVREQFGIEHTTIQLEREPLVQIQNRR
jgi:cobalt-zinc-cadmium efflux system protein